MFAHPKIDYFTDIFASTHNGSTESVMIPISNLL